LLLTSCARLLREESALRVLSGCFEKRRIMHSFFIQAYANFKGLFYWLNWPGYISGVLLQPFATVIMFSILGRFARNPDAAQEYALGIAVFSIAFVVMNGIGQSYSYDRMFGTISFVFVSPVNRHVNFLSRSILHYPNALISFTSGLVAAWAIVDLSFGAVNWTGFVISVLVVGASLTAAGQVLGVFSIAFRNWIAFQSMALGILLVLTGIIIPITTFPAFLRELAKLLPITNGLFAIKNTFAGGPFSEVFGHILREAVTGLVYYTIAFFGFLEFERVVKRTGALDRDVS
jgi:ABC-2 type transport system permease protein